MLGILQRGWQPGSVLTCISWNSFHLQRRHRFSLLVILLSLNSCTQATQIVCVACVSVQLIRAEGKAGV